MKAKAIKVEQLEPRRVAPGYRRYLKRKRVRAMRRAEDPRGFRGYAT